MILLILNGRDYVGDELTLYAAKHPDSLEKFYHQSKEIYRKYNKEKNSDKLTIYAIEHGTVKKHHVPLNNVTEMDMVFDPHVLNEIKLDLSTFFASDAQFHHYEIAHRRGILMYGPPGCGKTMMCKHIASIAKVPVLQFFVPNGCDSSDLINFFEYASDVSPAIVILEDIDTLFKGDLSRSNFLNLVDGVCTDKDTSMLIIATTNHLEDIDEAISKRPSRFDRQYFFNHPTPALREQYIKKRFAKLPNLIDIPEVMQALVKDTEKMSFAHLNEIYTQCCLKTISLQPMSIGEVRAIINNVKKETTNKRGALGLAPLAHISNSEPGDSF
jgi:SpoVK/Ycf46/Vps4 family AAA+-type ATPase